MFIPYAQCFTLHRVLLAHALDIFPDWKKLASFSFINESVPSLGTTQWQKIPSHNTKSVMLYGRISRTKESLTGLVPVDLFWKYHCGTWAPAWLILLYHVARLCRSSLFRRQTLLVKAILPILEIPFCMFGFACCMS